MDRRNFVIASGVAAASGIFSSSAFAQGKEGAGHQHDHGTPKARPVSAQLKELQNSTFDCLKVGEVCLAQCNAVLAGGKTSMAECQTAVLNMLAVVDATSKVGTYNTADMKTLKSLARTCADFCRVCEKECKPHADAHPECKDCMDACVRCYKACDAFIKA
jgi:Cys-rich four helix bundle protein (predicted Tat secretion target)